MEHSGTSGAVSAREAYSPVQPSEEGGYHVASTFEMPEELSPLTDYLSDLTDKEWVAFCQATADPLSKEQFFKLCVSLVQHVTMSSVTAVVPALVKLLREDPQQLLPSPERDCLLEAETSGPSLRCIEEGQYIAVLRNAGLTKAVLKLSSGKTQDARSPDSPLSSEERSQISLLNEFGVTEEGIQRSVQETLKELNVVGCQAGTEELTNAIVREAVIWLNTNLAELKKTVPNESESPAPRESFSPDKLVEKISMKLNSQKGAQGAMQQLLCWTRCNSKCSSEEDSVLSSTVGDSMTVVISTIESSLDEQSSVCKPAKCLLSTIRQAEKTLACQSSSLSDVFLSDTDLYGGSVESITQAGGQTQAVQPGMQALYSGEFLLKANKAVSSVLVIKMKQFDSAPSSATYLCATDTRASVAISRSETEHSPEVYLKHADAAASEIVDQFARDLQMCVESLQSLSISNKSDLGSPEGQGKGSEMKLGSLESAQDIPKKEFTSAALTMYQSVQGKVREFFPRLYFNRKQQYEHLEEIPSKDDIFDQSKATPALSGPLSESEDLPVTTDLQDCTNEVMGELLMAVKEQIAEDQTSCTEGKITPAGSYLAVNIMLELENNLCLSTSGHSLQSSAEKQGSGTPSILSPGSTASDLVGTVVGIQTLLQSTGYDAMDTDSKGNSKGDSAVSLDKSQVEVEASKVKIWSATKGMFGNLQGKVKDLFTKSQQHGSKVEDKASAEKAISDVIIGTEKDVPEFGPWEHDSEDLQRFHDTINAVFQRFGKVDVQQPASASSSAPKRKLSPLNQETLPGVLPIFSEIPSESPFTNIDSDGADDLDDAAVDESAAGITRDTMVEVVKAILEKVDLRDPSSSHAQGLTSVAQSLERFLSSSSVNSSSQDLIDHIYGLFMRSNNTTPEQCASDTVLLNQGQRKESGIPVASQILHIYIEESVKHLFLSCFKLPSPWSVNKDSSLQPAQTSNSCPGSLTDMASNYQDKMAATKSPSQILSDTVCLVNTMMVKEVINSLTVALSSNHHLEGSIQDQSTLSTSALITSVSGNMSAASVFPLHSSFPSETSRDGRTPRKRSPFRIFSARTRKTS